MRQYCTLFDSAYLSKGLAMIQSLLKHSSDELTVVHVLACDLECEIALRELNIRGVTIESLEHFEIITKVGELRKTRTPQEYFWTLGAVWTDYAFRNITGSWEVTYLDADTFLFSDPEQVFAEIGDKSIAITPHRFAKKDEARLLPNGKYAVQWITFRGEVGRRCLSEWSKNVRNWCKYENAGPGLFADQGYLDFWKRDYPGEVCEVQNIGVGTAPWNIGQYKITSGPCVDGVPIILYHFHELRHDESGNVTTLTGWALPDGTTELIYGPYSKAIRSAHEQIIQARDGSGSTQSCKEFQDAAPTL